MMSKSGMVKTRPKSRQNIKTAGGIAQHSHSGDQAGTKAEGQTLYATLKPLGERVLGWSPQMRLVRVPGACRHAYGPAIDDEYLIMTLQFL